MSIFDLFRKKPTDFLFVICVALILGFSVSSCIQNESKAADPITISDKPVNSDTIIYPETSFAYYLQHLPKKHGVYYWDGELKNNNTSVDIDVSQNQQCADAVIRLHAEWLWSQKRYHDIHYNFVNGFRADYTRYANGERIKVRDNNIIWVKAKESDYSYEVFREYLERVFQYANTASLEKELNPVTDKIQPGDVFIIGGFPGHAVIITDAYYDEDGVNLRCAQSWMPAQSIEYIKAHLLDRFQDEYKDEYCHFSNKRMEEFFNGNIYFEISGYRFDAKNLKRFEVTE